MPEMQQAAAHRVDLGELRWITIFTCKTWERYGIHALEAVSPLLGCGFQTVKALTDERGDVMHLTHTSGAAVTIGAIHDAYGSFGAVHLYGTRGQLPLRLMDTYAAFRAQLVAFITMLQTGVRPVSMEETVELMRVLIAGRESRAAGGSVVAV